MGKIIGIDLGTTNSCVSVMEGGLPVVIVNAEGNRTTPSVVAIKDGMRIVGETAKRQAVTNPDTVFSVKSKMGYTDKISLAGHEYLPQEISAMILQNLKLQAEAYLGQKVKKAVITVPAYFNDAQRQATKDAGKIAGLQVERIINEPTAAALAYGLDQSISYQTILVFDFGGGTFDVSILTLDNGLFEVKATAGDNRLGGDNFDQAIINYIINKFEEDNNIDLSLDVMAVSRIREVAEKAKRELSAVTSTNISLPFICSGPNGPLHLEYEMTRELFNELTERLVKRAIVPLKQAMKDAGIVASELDKVILVGGTTRIPTVIDMVKEVTGLEPHRGVNPDEAVAIGAAIQGGVISGEVEDLVLIDVTPLSLGIKMSGGLFKVMIPRNTAIPTSMSEVFSTAADNQSTVNVKAYQGERPMAEDNNLLGHFKLTGIAPAPRGVPQIEVTFSIDRNGIASVGAKDLRTGKSQTVVIQADVGLTDEDIARMVKQAEIYEESDTRRATEAELVNSAQHVIAQATQSLTKLSAENSDFNKADLLIKIRDLQTLLDEKKYGELKSKTEDLDDVISKLLFQLYKQELEGETN